MLRKTPSGVGAPAFRRIVLASVHEHDLVGTPGPAARERFGHVAGAELSAGGGDFTALTKGPALLSNACSSAWNLP